MQPKNSKILVTGGAGFVGSHIIDLLLKELDVKEVIVVDNFFRGLEENLTDALKTDKIKLSEIDIRDSNALDSILNGVDFCFHLAALRVTACAEAPREAVEVMINGTQNVIEACIKNGVHKLIAASSALIYGKADEFPTKESHSPYNNRTLYGALKASNELMYRAYKDMKGLNYVALRYFNIYGPRMDTKGAHTEVLIRWYKMIKEGKPPLIFGDGTQTMDFIHVKDVAKASLKALTADVTDEVFNVASGKETTLLQLCHTLLKVMKSPLQPEFVPLPEQRIKVEVTRRLADTQKAQKLLHFQSEISLEEGLQNLVDWLEENFR